MGEPPGVPDTAAPSAGDETAEAAAEVADLLHGVMRRLRRGAGDELSPLGLTPGQVRVLRILGRVGDPLRMGDLARKLDVVPRSATSVVDDLEARDLVVRRADPQDRRATLVSLTPAGVDALAAVRRRRHAAATELVGRLSVDDRATLRRLLRQLADDGSPPAADPPSPT